MPRCGSQVVLCDLPVRYDTYEGCSHACRYCFASRKSNIANIRNGESAEALKAFIRGKRTGETEAFDWDIPLHWGGMSDPFQPIERQREKSYEALRVFADTGYPFAVSTKNRLIAEPKYLELISRCNAVVQFSACTPRYDRIEQGASTFEERLKAAEKIAKTNRVNIRVQPYIPSVFKDVLAMIPQFAAAGVHGITIEGMKYTAAPAGAGFVRVAGDICYPVSVLLPQYKAIKDTCHKAGLKFYCAENRLRVMGDDLCCCGVDGLGWKLNKGNLNHLLFGGDAEFSAKQQEPGTCHVYKALHQTTLFQRITETRTFREQMLEEAKNPVAFMEGGVTYPKAIEEKMRLRLRAYLKASGRKAKDIDKHLGTNGMAGHYFGASQWAMPTPAAYEKMREIMPLPCWEDFFKEFGVPVPSAMMKIIKQV